MISIKKLQLLTVLMFLGTTVTFAQKQNFSGNWKINIEKSEFNGAPSYTAAKAYKIVQNDKTISIELTNVNQNNEEVLLSNKLTLDGKDNSSVTASKRTKTANVTWSKDAKMMIIKSQFSVTEQPDVLDYTTEQNWNLADDKKQLTVKSTTVTKASEYTITAVYDKQ